MKTAIETFSGIGATAYTAEELGFKPRFKSTSWLAGDDSEGFWFTPIGVEIEGRKATILFLYEENECYESSVTVKLPSGFINNLSWILENDEQELFQEAFDEAVDSYYLPDNEPNHDN